MNIQVAISYDAAMRLAVEHAELVKGSTYPNPPVGAVILDRDGRVAGAGGTEPAGSAHAEIVALRRAGALAEGGTAVATLEPCNHYGKTPPCVDALLDAGIATVVYAVADPNPLAAGERPGWPRRVCMSSRVYRQIWWRPGRCGSGCTSSAPDFPM